MLISDGAPVDYGGVGTMSKSKRNGIDPQALIDDMGADTARLFVMFTSPPEQTLEWSDSGVDGAYRFLKRVWAFAHKHHAAVSGTPGAVAKDAALTEEHKALRREVHLGLRQADYDLKRIQYNTVVSATMKMLNALESAKLPEGAATAAVLGEGLSILTRVLYPVVPHIAHALWVELGFAARHGGILDAPWPAVDEAALAQEEIDLVLQVNGKLRGHLRVPHDADKAMLEKLALASEITLKHTGGQAPKKVVVVPGRLVNVVV
jgi:leucyl-tRNA synthetase